MNAYQTNAQANSNTKNGINCVTHTHITQNTKEIEGGEKIVKAGVVKEGFMQEMKPELGIEKQADMEQAESGEEELSAGRTPGVKVWKKQ